MLETIKIGTNEFDLIVMGIIEKEKSRSFTISSDAAYVDIEAAFADASSIQYYSEAGELLKSYLDGVSLKTITHNLENSTYTIEISTDAVVAEIKALKELITSQ